MEGRADLHSCTKTSCINIQQHSLPTGKVNNMALLFASIGASPSGSCGVLLVHFLIISPVAVHL